MRYRIWHRFLIKLKWRSWLAPVICSIPYLASIFWLLYFSQSWIAIVLLVPALMMLLIGIMTWILAKLEFNGRVKG